jgi:hypothetical protein
MTMENTNTTSSPPVKLAELAIELGTTVDAVERELGRDTFRSGGFRCCTAFRASELIAEHDRRKEARRRLREEVQERIRAKRKANPIPPGRRLAVPEGVTAAQIMVSADGRPQYEGGAYRPVPTHLDWTFGNAEGGGTFGPPPRKRKES